MARIDNLTNFLTDVASAIKDKKGDNTPISASNFDTEIANLPSGGESSDSIQHPVFTGVVPVYESSSTTSWTQSNYNLTPSGYPKTDNCILIAFVRSDYTLSDNLTLLAETDWFTSGDINQKTIVALADISQSTGVSEITQASSGRMEVMMCHFMDAGEPTVILNENNASGKEFKTATDDYFNLYAFSKVTMSSSTYSSTDFDYFKYGTRLGFCWSDSASSSKTINIDFNNTAFGIIGIRIPYKINS